MPTTVRPDTGDTVQPRGDWAASDYSSDYGPAAVPRPDTGDTTRPASGTQLTPRGDWAASDYSSDYGPAAVPRP